MAIGDLGSPDATVELLCAIVSSVGEGVVALDQGGRVLFVNPAAARMLGRTEDELVGRGVEEMIEPVDSATHRGTIDLREIPRLSGASMWGEDAFFLRVDGTRLPVARTETPLLKGGERVGSVISFRDISRRKALEEQLIHRAFHDQLTGLANRALFLDRLAHAHARAFRSGSFYAVMFVDLDSFKSVNDSLGHGGGDDVLVAVARLIQLSARPSDTLARFGGDEFVLLLEDLTTTLDAEAVAERLLLQLETPLVVNGRELRVGASIGIATSDGRVTEPHDCLREADSAMYRAKRLGKGRYEVVRRPTEDE